MTVFMWVFSIWIVYNGILAFVTKLTTYSNLELDWHPALITAIMTIDLLSSIVWRILIITLIVFNT